MLFGFQSDALCKIADELIKSEIYSDFIQVFFFSLSLASQSYPFFFFLSKPTSSSIDSHFYSHSDIPNSKLQEHLAPSGYLKLPNVSITFVLGFKRHFE